MNPDVIAQIDDYLDSNIPFYMEGLPGVGKTEITGQRLALKGYYSEPIYASGREPSEIAGMPVKTDSGVVFSMPGYAVRLWEAHKQGKKTALVVDELTTCHPALQAPLLRAIREARFDDWAFPPDCRRIALGNPPSMGGWDLTAAMGNRFGQILNVTPDLDAWSEWNLKQPDPYGFRVEVVGFLKARPGLFLAPAKEWDSPGPKTSPRTWDMACKVRSDAARAGLVGAGPYSEFIQWKRAADLPSPEDVLNGKASLPDRSDARYATLIAIAALASRNKAYRAKAWQVIIGVADRALDEALVPARALAIACAPNIPPELGKLAPAIARISS